MEALATLSLAANIVQFIDFGTRLLSSANELSQSAEGSLKDNTAIEAVVEHLKTTLTRIQSSSSQARPAAQSLGTECTKIIENLLRALADLKVQNQPTRWRSFRKAIKSVRSKAVIEQWLDRLRSMREAYSIELEVDILESIDLNSAELKAALTLLEASQRTLTQTLLDAIKADRDNFEVVSEQHALDLRDIIRTYHDDLKLHVSDELNGISSQMSTEHANLETRNAEAHRSTRDHVTASVELSNISLSDHVTRSNMVQSSLIEANSIEEHNKTRAVFISEADLSKQYLADELEIHSFSNRMDVAAEAQRTTSFLSHQLANTNMLVHSMMSQSARAYTYQRNPTDQMLQSSSRPAQLATVRDFQGSSEDLDSMRPSKITHNETWSDIQKTGDEVAPQMQPTVDPAGPLVTSSSKPTDSETPATRRTRPEGDSTLQFGGQFSVAERSHQPKPRPSISGPGSDDQRRSADENFASILRLSPDTLQRSTQSSPERSDPEDRHQHYQPVEVEAYEIGDELVIEDEGGDLISNTNIKGSTTEEKNKIIQDAKSEYEAALLEKDFRNYSTGFELSEYFLKKPLDWETIARVEEARMLSKIDCPRWFDPVLGSGPDRLHYLLLAKGVSLAVLTARISKMTGRDFEKPKIIARLSSGTVFRIHGDELSPQRVYIMMVDSSSEAKEEDARKPDQSSNDSRASGITTTPNGKRRYVSGSERPRGKLKEHSPFWPKRR